MAFNHGGGPVDEHVEEKHSDDEHGEETHQGDAEERIVSLPKPMWQDASLKVEPVTRRSITGQTWATVKAMLNEDRSAHIYSITEGRAHKVPVELGDRVNEGHLLDVIDSRPSDFPPAAEPKSNVRWPRSSSAASSRQASYR